jgi:TP901 family phage tail tape measure protein
MSVSGLGSASGELLIDIAQAMANLTTLENRVKGLAGTGGDTFKGAEAGGTRLDALGTKLDGVNRKYGELGKAGLGVGVATAAAFGLAINSAANFEQSMSNVGAALGGVGGDAGLTQEQFKALNDEALLIGATTSVSAGEATQAMELLAKSGLDATQILEGGAAAVVSISEATGESIQQSSESFGALTNLFADTGISASQMADAIVVGMNNSNSTLSEFQTGIARLAPVIAQTGMSFYDSAASIAYFNSRGFSAAEVGTSLTRAFTDLADPIDGTGDAMRAMGIDAFDAQGNFVGFPAIMDQVAAATAGMSDEQRTAALSTIFSADAIDLMADASKTGGDDLVELTEKTKEEGVAAEQAAARMDNFKGSIEKFKGAIASLAIVIGTPLLGPLRAVTDFLAKLVEGFLTLPKPIQTAIAALIGITGALAGVAGAIVVFGPQVVKIAAQMQKMVGAITRIIPALLGLSLPILLIIAALALLAIAYKTNFLGFADAVNSVASSVKSGFEGIIAFLGKVKAAFDAFSSVGQNPVAALLNAIGLELEAIAGKFGPFEGAVRAVAEALRLFGTMAQDVGLRFAQLSGSMNPVAAALQAIGDVLSKYAASFGPLAGVVGFIGEAFQLAGIMVNDFVLRFRQLSGNLNPVAAALQALGDVLKKYSKSFGPLARVVGSLGKAFKLLGQAAGDVGDILQAAFKGDWNEVLEETESLLRRLTGGYLALIAAFLSFPLSLLSGAFGLLSDAFASLADRISGPFSDALQGISDAFGNLGEAAGNFGDAIIDIFSGDFGDALDNIQEGLTNVGEAFLDLGGAAVNALQGAWEALSGVDWGGALDTIGTALSGIGSTIADAVGNAAEWLAPKAVDAVTGLVDALVENFPRVLSWVGSIGQFIGVAVANAAEWLAPRAVEAITGLVDAFVENFPRVLSWVSSIGQFIGTAVANAAEWLAPRAVEAVTGFLDALVENFPRVLAWIGSIGQFIGAAIVDAAQWLAPKAIEMVTGFLDALVENFPTVLAWIGSIDQFVSTAAGNLIDALKPKGVELIQGILDGINEKWKAVQAWLGLIGTTAGNAVGELGETLKAKGLQLLAGLWAGAIEKLDQILAWAATIPDSIAAAIANIGQALYDAGLAAFENLWEGLKSKWEEIKSWASGLSIPWPDIDPRSSEANPRGGDPAATERNTRATVVPALDLSLYLASLSAMEIATTTAFTNAGIAVGVAVSSIVANLGLIAAPAAAVGVALSTLATSANTSMVNIGIAVGTAVSSVTGNLSRLGTAFNTAQTTITTAINTARSNVTSAANTMTQTLNSFATAAGRAGTNAGNDFERGLTSGVRGAVREAQTGRGQMIAALTLPSMYASGASVGNSLGEGLAAGIRNQIDAVAAEAANLVTAALNAARNAAASNSPSRKTMAQGRDLARGMEIGIERGTPAVVQAFGQIIPFADSGAARQFGNMPSSGSAPVSHVTVIALKSEEWLEMVKAAETGRDFANEFPYTLGGRR